MLTRFTYYCNIIKHVTTFANCVTDSNVFKSKMNKIDMPFKKLIFSRENQFSLFYMQLCKILWIKKERKKEESFVTK